MYITIVFTVPVMNKLVTEFYISTAHRIEDFVHRYAYALCSAATNETIVSTPIENKRPLLLTWIKLISTWMGNWIHNIMRDDITYPLPNPKGVPTL